jgi:hypothetical protein
MAERGYVSSRRRAALAGYLNQKVVIGYWDEVLRSDGVGGGSKFVCWHPGWGCCKLMGMGCCPLR